MEDKDLIKDIFQEKLKGHTTNVDPSVWAKVASGTGVKAGTAGTSLLMKGILAVAVTVTSVGGIVLYTSNTSNDLNVETNNTVENSIIVPSVDVISSVENTTIISADNSVNVKKSVSEKVEPVVVDEINNLHDVVFIEPISVDNTVEVIQDPQEIVVVNSEKAVAIDSQIDVIDEIQVVKPEISDTPSEVHNNIPEVEEVVEHKEFVLPNVFTPNSDRLNDQFYISFEEDVKDFSIVIMNEKQEVMFKSNDPSFKWDGFNLYGNKVDKGNYVYFITGVFSDNTPFQKYSSLRIL